MREDDNKTQEKNREARPETMGDRGVCAIDDYDGIAIVQHHLGFVKHV